jgi:flagellar capping protein FliD
MATFNKFQSFVEALAEKVHKLDSDILRVALASAVPLATNTVLANITQIAAGNGYVAGGNQALQATLPAGSIQTGGVYKLTLNDVTFTATPGNMAAFQYVVLYNDSAANKELIGWYDYGTPLTVTAGNSFTVDFDGTNGVLTIT